MGNEASTTFEVGEENGIVFVVPSRAGTPPPGRAGAAGAHARSAVGLAALPNGACIEIEMILEVED
jgi:enamine deaminase RidA (YjgF/YER057c/UK114 family)